jgi:ATP-dependent DNA helicase RecG
VGPDTPLRKVLGDRTAEALETHLELSTVGELLRHYPRRYAERGELTPIRELELGEHVTVMARVKRSTARATRGGKWLVEVVVTDLSADLRLTFFYPRSGQAQWREKSLPPGYVGLFSGRVSEYQGRLQLQHPEVLDEDDRALIPLYAATEKLTTDKIAKAIDVVLQGVELPDPLPPSLREGKHLLPLMTALRGIHQPDDWAQVNAARKRLKWDEAFILQAFLALRRREVQELGGQPRPGTIGGLRDAFDARLPFELTRGQHEVGDVIDVELEQPHPMHRLLQGEVGSGKTVVALRAMLRVVDSGGQAALLAPTEVLAQQHHRSILAMLGDLATAGELGSPDVATRVALLTGSLNAAARRSALREIADGSAGIVVGTHALISEGVEFHDLGMVVVDEQHRFGVEQRDLLRAKGMAPHTLVMTATPIPRTIAMTVYGDLDTSELRELPAGRQPLATHVVPVQSPSYGRTWERVREEVAAGRQAFVVCPRIGGDAKEEDEQVEDGKRPSVAVEDLLPALVDGPLAGLRVEGLHGRMAADAKDEVMTRFARGEVDVLVATTVIEVGVDVPNATVMVVMDAERFGVSQLHQLRGRVGRGEHGGLCLLVTDVEADSPSADRLRAVAESSDGFELAEFDLRQRREGNVLGTNQSGRTSSLRLLQVVHDGDLIIEARLEASTLVDADPDLSGHPALRAAMTAMLDEEEAVFIEKA